MSAVYESAVVDAPVEKVWAAIRDFNGLPSWHPGLAASEIENGQPDNQIGVVRKLTLKDGAIIKERLLALDDHKRFVTYTILESPFEFQNYVATLRVRPITDGNKTFVEWHSTFKPNSQDKEAGIVAIISGGVYKTGFQALQTRSY
eukprot:TRINITY_DN71_c0_g1_i1.p1 TRINITY_DN71_c0_g1~~TRINITY_DN71_c0_g1_i1.p1  ORF type:complete len:146 (+),score=38.37 TRINITY_DN71_c0_g1_i1:130-567(+)